MNISINTNFNCVNIKQPQLNNNRYNSLLNNCSYDSFELNSQPAFCGKKVEKKETKKIEEQLKNLDGVHDPYSDVMLISTRKFELLKNKLKTKDNAEATIKLLNNYEQHMFPVSEKEVFNYFKEETHYRKRNGVKEKFDFRDLLLNELPYSKTRLINQELYITNSMKEISKKLDKESQRTTLNKISQIEDDIYNDCFTIDKAKVTIEKLHREIKDKKVFSEIQEQVKKFPNSMTSFDAFIVKHANDTHQEIAEALISPAIISIEHIKPKSKGGETKGENFIAASRRMNNYRSSRSLDEFVKEFPNIPRCTQRYMDDLIRKINRGGIPNIAYTLPGVRDNLIKESNSLISPDITEIRPQISKEIDIFRQNIDRLIGHFSTKE